MVSERSIMVTDELLALASAGGAALVGAVAKDAWAAAKGGFARLLGRGDPAREAAVEHQLERTRTALQGAGPEADQVRGQQEAVWAGRLEDLLAENPDAAAELTALVRQITEATGTRSAGHVVQHATASGNAQQAVLGHGHQTNTFGAPPSRADG
jgi:hypothetical protein